MNKKLITILFSVGLMSGLAVSTNAYTKSGSCNRVECNAVMNHDGNDFRAGTYSDNNMQNISVSLDGEGEWWADKDNKHNTTSAYMATHVGSGHAYSNHHADNDRGDDFDRSIEYINGVFK
jgi:hypothetical protein